MVLLALETATRAGSVAVARDDELLVARAGDPATPHAIRLPGDLMAALSDAGLRLADVDRLAVCLGPGAFTGLRIGIAAMQGLSMATDLPVVGVSALDALATAAGARGAAADVGVWMEAGRGEVFAHRYRILPDGRAVAAGEPVSAPPAVVLEAWKRHGPLPDRWVGDAALGRQAWLAEACGGTVDVETPLPLIASWIARLARASAPGRPHALRPLYVRRPDAELARDRRLAGGARS